MTKQEKKFLLLGILFVLPWLIGFLVFQVYPIGSAIYYSLTDFNLFADPNFIGFQNYITLFTDPLFPQTLMNTAFMTFIGVPVGLVVALGLALLLNMNVKGVSIFRTIYYMPTMMPVVASATLFTFLLMGDGLLNQALRLLGVPPPGPGWLSDPLYTKWSLLMMDVWRCGQTAVVFLSGLQAVPQSFYEAAEIDGAGTWRKFWNITIPSIGPAIEFNLIINMINSFQYFTQAYTFASVTPGSGGQKIGGGPFNSLLFYCLYLYQQGFAYLRMGFACAMAIVLFIIVLTLTLIIFRLLERNISYDQE